MAIFNSYISLPEGNLANHQQCLKAIPLKIGQDFVSMTNEVSTPVFHDQTLECSC
jgi:hypothetical protein